MDLFKKADVESVDYLMYVHFQEHQSRKTKCSSDCRRLAMMLAINSVIEDRNERVGS